MLARIFNPYGLQIRANQIRVARIANPRQPRVRNKKKLPFRGSFI
jgi:hypothetical protein